MNIKDYQTSSQGFFATLVIVLLSTGCSSMHAEKHAVQQVTTQPIPEITKILEKNEVYVGSSEALSRVTLENLPTKNNQSGVVIKNVALFPTNSTRFITDTGQILNELQPFINNSKGRILVEGHTDSRGARDLNKRLSDARARVVARELVQRKIPPSRISIFSYGFDRQRIYPEITDMDRQLNRRVEIVMLGESVTSSYAENIENQLNNMIDSLDTTF